jgi:hypothetical protein
MDLQIHPYNQEDVALLPCIENHTVLSLTNGQCSCGIDEDFFNFSQEQISKMLSKIKRKSKGRSFNEEKELKRLLAVVEAKFRSSKFVKLFNMILGKVPSLYFCSHWINKPIDISHRDQSFYDSSFENPHHFKRETLYSIVSQ